MTDQDTQRPTTKAERSRQNRVEFWLKVRRELEDKLRDVNARLHDLGIDEDDQR